MRQTLICSVVLSNRLFEVKSLEFKGGEQKKNYEIIGFCLSFIMLFGEENYVIL